jgi:hypothetical protein
MTKKHKIKAAKPGTESHPEYLAVATRLASYRLQPRCPRSQAIRTLGRRRRFQGELEEDPKAELVEQKQRKMQLTILCIALMSMPLHRRLQPPDYRDQKYT